MAFDWVVGWWTEEAAKPWGVDWLDASVGQQAVLQLISDADLADHGDDLVVERVIGQYWLYADDAADQFSNHVHIRLVVRPEDPGPGGVWNAPIGTFVMADEKFLWHKVLPLVVSDGTVLPGEQTGFQNYQLASAHPEWSHLDVKVNRRLQELERLCLIFEMPALAAGQAGKYHVAAWIRVLVRS